MKAEELCPAPGLPTSERTFTTRTAAEIEAAGPPSCPNEGVRKSPENHLPRLLPRHRAGQQPRQGQPERPYDRPPAGACSSRPTANRPSGRSNGGAPGANSGTRRLFLARRTGPGPCPAGSATEQSETGWCSTSLVPPAAQQLGGGSLHYESTSPARPLSSSWARPPKASARAPGAPVTAVRYDGLGGQHVFSTVQKARPSPQRAAAAATTANAPRRPRDRQLEDFGSGAPAQLISIMPDGFPAACEAFSARPGNSLAQWRPENLSISADGSRAYFVARSSKPAPNNDECETSTPFGLYFATAKPADEPGRPRATPAARRSSPPPPPSAAMPTSSPRTVAANGRQASPFDL